jgi:hypothetical protein
MRKHEKALLVLAGLLLAVAVGDVARIVALRGDVGAKAAEDAGTEAIALAWACYDPPWIWLIVPGGGDTVSGTTPIEVEVNSGIEVTGIDLYLDGKCAITLDSAPYTCEWDTTQVTDGAHTLMAVAYSMDGAILESEKVHVTVKNKSWSMSI